MPSVWLVLLSLAAGPAQATTLLVTTDAACRLTVNGDDHGVLQPGEVKTLPVPPGDNLVRAYAIASDAVWLERPVAVMAGRQRLVRLGLAAEVAQVEAEQRQQRAAERRRRALRDRFAAPGDGTLRDVETGLQWTQRGNGYEVTWADAAAYCDELTAAGHDDWRLPALAELETIADAAFAPQPCGDYRCAVPPGLQPTSIIAWSATRTGASQAYGVNLFSGESGEFPVGSYHAFHCLCVRSHDPVAVYLRQLRRRVEAAEAAGASVIAGDRGFLFPVSELRGLASGRFWGEDAAGDGRASARDPLPAIRELAAQVRAAGAELWFVPVPAKATVYPAEAVPGAGFTGRPDRAHREFLDVLAREGIRTIDLAPCLRAARDPGADPVYCRHDSHWSPRGLALAADAIAAALEGSGALAAAGLARRHDADVYERKGDVVTIHGDLVPYLPEADRPLPESLRIERVGRRQGDRWQPVPIARDSPVLLLADSHGLVFHAGGDMHARGAGLVDHLAGRLGVPLDLIAVRGSGATPPRLNLRRRGTGLDGKKVVIWCFSVREYTAGRGWRSVPIGTGTASSSSPSSDSPSPVTRPR